MKYLKVKYKHYIRYVSENKTDRLDKGLKIFSHSGKVKKLFNINEEIFEEPIKCDFNYKINNEKIKVTFFSKNKKEYRLDIFKIEEFGETYNHIAFTLNNDIFDKRPESKEEQDLFELEYEKPTNLNEVYDVLGRIRYVLRSLVEDKVITNNFCIGGSIFYKKNNLYEYFLKFVVGESGFEKRKTNKYTTGWGLYFNI